MKKYLLNISLFLVLISCSSEPKKTSIVLPKIDFKKDLLSYFESNFKLLTDSSSVQKIPLDSVPWLRFFYKNVGFTPVWINDSIEVNTNGKLLIEQLATALNYGIDTTLYNTSALRKLDSNILNIKNKEDRYALAFDIEVLLSNYYMLHGKHLNYGVLERIDSVTILPRKKFSVDMPSYFLKAYKNDSLFEKLVNLQPKSFPYRELQKGLVRYLKTASLSKDSVPVENFRIDSLNAIIQSKKALVLHKYLDSVSNDSLFFDALKKFQFAHGLESDGLIGKNTAKALSKSPYSYYQTIAANLERWRWKEELETDFILVNIPSYQLEVFKENKLMLTSKTVVGKRKTQTPEIRDSLQYVIAYPYWNVPRKISVEEILVNAKKDSTYLIRNKYEVLTYTKESVAIDSVNWEAMNNDTFNYLIRQKGGGYNSLGLVKFIFPNKHAIYLHDTPSKQHFNFETRAYSHGCVRVEKAMELSNYILESDNNKYSIDSIYKFIEKEKEKPIKLNYRLPVYIYYLTAKVNQDDNLILYEDIYGLDSKLIESLKQQQKSI